MEPGEDEVVEAKARTEEEEVLVPVGVTVVVGIVTEGGEGAVVKVGSTEVYELEVETGIYSGKVV